MANVGHGLFGSLDAVTRQDQCLVGLNAAWFWTSTATVSHLSNPSNPIYPTYLIRSSTHFSPTKTPFDPTPCSTPRMCPKPQQHHHLDVHPLRTWPNLQDEPKQQNSRTRIRRRVWQNTMRILQRGSSCTDHTAGRTSQRYPFPSDQELPDSENGSASAAAC